VSGYGDHAVVVYDNRAGDIETETQMRMFILLPILRDHQIEDQVLQVFCLVFLEIVVA
jgi:hypothetical protein